MDASYLKMAFHERHTIGHQCGIGPQNLLIRHKLSNSGYMKLEAARKSTYYQGAIVFNELPENTRKETNYRTFKKQLN